MNVNNYILTPFTIQIIVIQLKAEYLTEQVLMVSEQYKNQRETHREKAEGEGRTVRVQERAPECAPSTGGH